MLNAFGSADSFTFVRGPEVIASENLTNKAIQFFFMLLFDFQGSL